MITANELPALSDGGFRRRSYFGGASPGVREPGADTYAALLGAQNATGVRWMIEPNIRPGFIKDNSAGTARGSDHMLGWRTL